LKNQPEEEVRIYFSKDFNKNEVAEITNAFNEIIPTRGLSNSNIGLDAVDAKTVVETAFIMLLIVREIGLTEIGKGFFNSIGSDLKDKLVQTLRTKKNSQTQNRETPIIRCVRVLRCNREFGTRTFRLH